MLNSQRELDLLEEYKEWLEIAKQNPYYNGFSLDFEAWKLAKRLLSSG